MKWIGYALFIGTMGWTGCHAPAPLISFEQRAKSMVDSMTLAEKVSLLVYNSPAIERLNIPQYNWWNECLHGVARAGRATVFPQAIGMAATWDKTLMFGAGTAISDEARAKYHDFVAQNKRGIYQGLTFWTPNINLFRDPRWGRGMETYGEDPFLTGELAVQFIRSLQGDDPVYYKTIATAKHFVVHSGPEWNRHSFNATPSLKDFNESYSPQFKKAVQQGGVYSVMCAYNRYQGKPCCGNPYLDSLLRVQWQFKGYIVSDCWAIRDFFAKGAHEVVPTREEAAAMALHAGTDLNCGDSYPALIGAVGQGLVSESQIDRSVERLMLARLKLGMFDADSLVPWSKISSNVIDCDAHRDLALQSAQKSLVLLKNEANLLPLSASVRKIAVIGPNANQPQVLLGNYNGFPSSSVTPFEGIRALLPHAEVAYELGCTHAAEMPYMVPVPSEMLFVDAACTQPGLKGEYFATGSSGQAPLHTRTDSVVHFVWGNQAPFPDMNPQQFDVKWSGYLKPKQSGRYAIGGDGYHEFSVWINQKQVAHWASEHHPHMEYSVVEFTAGETYAVKMEYSQRETEHAHVSLLWDAPNPSRFTQAIAAASQAEVVVLCLGLSPLLEGEEMNIRVDGFKGGDRERIALPKVQTDLAKAIMALNKPTVLVLLNGSALAINWEAQHIPAILEAWYPGQAGGTAIAHVLFGQYNPAGRLPVTFYKSEAQLPDFEAYGMAGRTYRFLNQEPLYPFGHGLSYTTFAYQNLKMAHETAAGDSLTVSVEVTNTGLHPGDEVVQLYLSFPDSKLPDTPVRSLQGFERVQLDKGETQTVQFKLSPHQMGLFDQNGRQSVMPGIIRVSVGGGQPVAVHGRIPAHVCGNVTVKGQLDIR